MSRPCCGMDFTFCYTRVIFTASLRLLFFQISFFSTKTTSQHLHGYGRTHRVLELVSAAHEAVPSPPKLVLLSAVARDGSGRLRWEAALEEGWVCGEVNTTAESSSESCQCFQQAI